MAAPPAAALVDEEHELIEIMFAVTDFAQPLREEDVDPDPVRQFAAWFDQATSAAVRAPEAAALATAATGGMPSVRMVLIKRFDDCGFVFSSYESRKGRELAVNPRAALMFHWDLLGRQVRIEGQVERTSRDESAAYVRGRPRASQISALASPQSRTIDLLEQRVVEVAAIHEGRELTLPGAWGGFRLLPETFEFWQHREDRLHDRLRYKRPHDGGWRLERLAP